MTNSMDDTFVRTALPNRLKEKLCKGHGQYYTTKINNFKINKFEVALSCI